MKYNYIPGSMSFGEGMLGPKGDVGFIMEYSDSKARAIIQQLLDEGRNIVEAMAGLDGDWNINSCCVFDGKDFHEYDVHEGSQWATPILIVIFSDADSEMYEVWDKKEKKYESTYPSIQG